MIKVLPCPPKLGYLTEVDCFVTTAEGKERSQTFQKYEIRDDDVIDADDSEKIRVTKASCVDQDREANSSFL